MYSFGDDDGKLGEYAWYKNNSGDKTNSVGKKQSNTWGLYDMHGNVWEWVEDDWHPSYTGAPNDGRAWIDEPRAANYVTRGGSWSQKSSNLRSATRAGAGPAYRSDRVGIRLARNVTIGP